VVKIPEPQVLLEEFGDRGRVFMVNYWLEIRLDVDPNQVASELKLAVERAFQDAGLKALSAA
jgi:small-conductance mechanosensitive channel